MAQRDGRRRVDRIRGRWARTLLSLCGWQLTGEAPDVPRCIVIFAPHTSNWDFPLLLLVRAALRPRIKYLAKRSLFRFPFAPLFRWTLAIPVDRSQPGQVVAELRSLLATSDDLWIALSPEGTRAKRDRWKTGFYRLATESGVPVLCAFIDAARRQCGVGPLLYMTGDVAVDIGRIREFYADKRGIHPERESEIRFREDF